jgi:hypothetical protein
LHVLLSFYLITVDRKRRFRRYQLMKIDHRPTDWIEMKLLLQQATEKVHVQHNRTENLWISLERHLPTGASVTKITEKYRMEKIHLQREYEAMFKISYNPKMGELHVDQASFNYTLNHLREGFWWEERGIKCRSGPVIPKEHRDADINQMVMERQGTRYVSYSQKPNPIYGKVQENTRLSYGKKPQMLYGRKQTLRE